MSKAWSGPGNGKLIRMRPAAIRALVPQVAGPTTFRDCGLPIDDVTEDAVWGRVAESMAEAHLVFLILLDGAVDAHEYGIGTYAARAAKA